MATGKWGRVILREICDTIDYGYTASASQEPIGPKFLRITDIVPDRVDWSSVPHCGIEEKKLSKYRLEKGDIVIARTGATTGYAKRIRENREAVFASYLVRLRVSVDYDSQYVGFVIESDDYKQFIQQNIGGTAQPQANAQVLTSFPIPLPPIETQHKIATILSNYDDLIENNTRRIKILEEMASAIYREWFVKFRFPGHENVKMVESELRLIPQGWKIRKLSELVETQHGYTESATEDEVGPKFVRGKDVNKTSYIDWNLVPFCPIDSEKYAKYRLHVNDVLVIRMADPGKVAIIEKDVEAVFASYLIRLKIRSSLLSPYYLFYSLLDRRYQDYMYGASTGTTRKSASAGVITDFNLVIPTSEVRDRFETKIASIRKGLNNLLDKNTNLRKTRDLLLPRLISGELDVSDLDIATDLHRSQEGEKPMQSAPAPIWMDRIAIDEKILTGKPVIKGTRLAVEFIIDLLAHGWSEAEILENYPGIVVEDIRACLAYADKTTVQ